MPQNKYKITDQDTGESYVVNLPKPPSEDDAVRIIDLKRQEKQTLSQADKASKLFTWPNVKKAGLDVVKSLASPENLGTAAITAAAPEFALPVMGALMGGQALAQGYKAYKEPTTANIVESVGSALGSGLSFMGARANNRTPMMGVENPPVAPQSRMLPPAYPVETTPNPNYSVTPGTNQYPYMNYIDRSGVPATRPEPLQGQFVDPTTYTDIPVKPPMAPKSPAQVSGGQRQIGAGRVIEAPGEVPADTSSVKGITPKEVKGTAATKGSRALRRTYSSHEGEHIPQVLPPDESIPTSNIRDITPEETQQVTQQQPQPKSQSEKITQAQEPPKTKKIDNEWLRQQDDIVLKTMRPGAKGQLADEIDTVLNERTSSKNEKVPKEEPQKSPKEASKEEPPESKINEQVFNQYQEMLNDLLSHGPKAGHLTLRDIAALGKSAGLDQEMIVNDLIDNIHPETTNIPNKAWNATDKVFNPELDK